MADAQDSGSCARKGVRVQVPPRALLIVVFTTLLEVVDVVLLDGVGYDVDEFFVTAQGVDGLGDRQ